MKPWAVPLLLGLAALAVLWGLAAGAADLSLGAVWGALWDPAAPGAAIVRQLRAPRILLAFGVGGALAVSGAALQALIRNPLADPYLLGLSGGAGVGAVVAMALQWPGTWAVPIAAFTGALGAVALVYRLASVVGRRLDPRVLLLAGVIVGAFAGAIMTAIITLSTAEQLRNAFLWLLGGFAGASWPTVGLFAAWGAIPLTVLALSSRGLDLLHLGDEPAESLGADVDRLRRRVLVATSLLTAVGVAVSGIVGFVGLIVPHAMRGLVGPIHRALLPAVFVAGGTFVVVADTLSRTVVRPMELPVGVVTALVGVPIFAMLLRRSLR